MNTQEINSQILTSKQYVENKYFYFPHPEQIINPLINILGSDIELKGSHEITVGEQDASLTAYGRVTAIKNIAIDETMNYQIGFIYALDSAKPFIKVFTGVNVKACTNLCIFNASHIAKYDVLGNTEGSYETVKEFFKNKLENCNEAVALIKEMKNFKMSLKQVQDSLGKLLYNFSASKSVAGTICITNAAKLITDRSSSYFCEADQQYSAWELYNALTDGFREKTHLLDQPEKVLALYREIKDICVNKVPAGTQLLID